MAEWLYLVGGYIAGLITAVAYVLGWRSYKNVEECGIIAPNLRRKFGKKHEIIVNTPERELELERERLEEEEFGGTTEDLVPESY